jgi:hypothetical protein
MAIKILSRADLEAEIFKVLDEIEWEITSTPSPQEVLDFIADESGLIGLPGDEPGEVEYFDVEMLDELEIQSASAVEYQKYEVAKLLENLLVNAITDLTIRPVEISQSLNSAGSLMRQCYAIEIGQDGQKIACYVREAGSCDTFKEDFSGPMW